MIQDTTTGESSYNTKNTELAQELKSYQRFIKRHPEDSNAYYMQAGTYVNLLNLARTESNNANLIKEYYDNAISSYNHAITNSSDHILYIVDRAKLYIQMGDNELAKKDYLLAQQLSDKYNDNSNSTATTNYNLGNKVTDLHVANVMRELAQHFTAESPTTVESSELVSPMIVTDQLNNSNVNNANSNQNNILSIDDLTEQHNSLNTISPRSLASNNDNLAPTNQNALHKKALHSIMTYSKNVITALHNLMSNSAAVVTKQVSTEQQLNNDDKDHVKYALTADIYKNIDNNDVPVDLSGQLNADQE